MAQPIYFSDRPKYLLLEGEAKGRIGESIGQGIAGMMMAYTLEKDKQREERIKAITALGVKLGFNNLGQDALKQFEADMGGGKPFFPRDESGKLKAPLGVEEQTIERLKKVYGDDPQKLEDMTEVALGLRQPPPSREALDAKKQEAQSKAALEALKEKNRWSRWYAGQDREDRRARLRYDMNYRNVPSGLAVYKGKLMPISKVAGKPGAGDELSMGAADLFQGLKGKALKDDKLLADMEATHQRLWNDRYLKPVQEALKILGDPKSTIYPAQKRAIATGLIARAAEEDLKMQGVPPEEIPDRVTKIVRDNGFTDYMMKSMTGEGKKGFGGWLMDQIGFGAMATEPPSATPPGGPKSTSRVLVTPSGKKYEEIPDDQE